ncbi:GH3 domain-containing protein-like [Ylistrum balloti]|uniref:GH3 domain-containing protein-like n=1 Tax=Ylistrum balloti TaxID=509963 RepID=UPI002905AEF5|nr:GH3 domain-containing protein-like [Ylistrum balloti]
MKWGVCVGVAATILGIYFCHFLVTVTWGSVLAKLWAASMLGVCIVTLTLTIDFYRRDFDEMHFYTIRSKINHYIANAGLAVAGQYQQWKMDKSTKDIKAAQNEILFQRLKKNKDTEYGIKYKFSEVKTREDFVKCHPLTRISHYEDYINRMMSGEKNILTSAQPIIFAVTSGTSGKSSVIPMIKEQRILFFLQGVAVAYNSMIKAYPGSKSIQKNLKLFYTPKMRESPSGIPVGPNSSSPANSKAMLSLYSTPSAGYEILSEPEALYVHLLFAIRDRNIGILEANFSSIVYNALRALEYHWESLADDIEKGCISASLKIDDRIRSELDKSLSPDIRRADEIRASFKDGRMGLVKRLWPNCNVVLGTDTGAFALQGDMLRETFCKGVPLYSPLYAASEGLLGVNIWPLERPSHYLLAPQSMFCEFIPVENSDEDQPQTYFMDQVERGRVYELVITTASGLMRYRFGDVVKVVDFYNQCPVIEFMYRQGQLLNVRGEKTSEVALFKALSEGVAHWPGAKLVDYCCAESVLVEEEDPKDKESYVPFYHVFVELEQETSNFVLLDEQRNLVDESLCKQSYVYQSFRKKGSIHPMRIHIVSPGTFQKLRDFTIATTSASANQYKAPRVLKRKDAVEMLMKNVVK